mmetsp:Transcript_7523/g.12892  ORF Transcript_7523/g.12892 Transcript_7523/m.12892 type:complete len:214 (-) Transcript_7523:1217-1858(-)
MVLLFFGAKFNQHRPQHIKAKGHNARRIGTTAFFLKNMLLHRAPSWSTKLFGPDRRQPTACVQDGMPLFHHRFGQLASGPHRARNLFWKLLSEKRPHFITECQIFFGITQVHGITFLCSNRRTSYHPRPFLEAAQALASNAHPLEHRPQYVSPTPPRQWCRHSAAARHESAGSHSQTGIPHPHPQVAARCHLQPPARPLKSSLSCSGPRSLRR